MYLSDVTRSWLSPNATQSWTAALKLQVGGKEMWWGIHLQGAAAEHKSSLDYCMTMAGTCFEGWRDLILPPNVNFLQWPLEKKSFA